MFIIGPIVVRSVVLIRLVLLISSEATSFISRVVKPSLCHDPSVVDRFSFDFLGDRPFHGALQAPFIPLGSFSFFHDPLEIRRGSAFCLLALTTLINVVDYPSMVLSLLPRSSLDPSNGLNDSS